MAEKIYQSKHGAHQMSCEVNGKMTPIMFSLKPKGHSEFKTSSTVIQAHIESTDAFKTGVVRVKWTRQEKLVAKAKALRAVADKAEAEAKAAEADAAPAPAAPVKS